MILGRLIGWLLLASAALLLVRDAWLWASGGAFRFLAGGELWFLLAPESLNVAQAITQRYLLPELWDPGMITLLLMPAWVVLGGLGLIFVTLFRRRRRRRGRFG